MYFPNTFFPMSDMHLITCNSCNGRVKFCGWEEEGPTFSSLEEKRALSSDKVPLELKRRRSPFVSVSPHPQEKSVSAVYANEIVVVV